MAWKARIARLWRQIAGYHRNVYMIYILTFLIGFVLFGGLYQVLVNLFLVRMGYGPEFVGLLNGIGLLCLSLGSVLSATLAMRFRQLAIVRYGFLLYMIGAALFALSIFVPVLIRRAWLLASYAFGYSMVSLVFVQINPLVMASTTADERNTVFSHQMALLSLGGFTGAWFGGFMTALSGRLFSLSLDTPQPYAYAMLVGASLLVIGLVAVAYLRPAQQRVPAQTGSVAPMTARQESPFPLKIILLVAVVITLRVVGEQSVRIFVNLFLDAELGVHPTQIANIYSTGQLLSIPAPLMAPMLMARIGRGQVFNWATVAVAICVIATAMASNWIVVAVSYVFLIGLAQIARPAIMIISMESVDPKWQASMSGSNVVAFGLSGLLTSTAGGLMIGSVGFRLFFVASAVVTLAGVAVFWAGFLRRDSTHEPVRRPVS